jgi:hypothetical protein
MHSGDGFRITRDVSKTAYSAYLLLVVWCHDFSVGDIFSCDFDNVFGKNRVVLISEEVIYEAVRRLPFHEDLLDYFKHSPRHPGGGSLSIPVY